MEIEDLARSHQLAVARTSSEKHALKPDDVKRVINECPQDLDCQSDPNDKVQFEYFDQDAAEAVIKGAAKFANRGCAISSLMTRDHIVVVGIKGYKKSGFDLKELTSAINSDSKSAELFTDLLQAAEN